MSTEYDHYIILLLPWFIECYVVRPCEVMELRAGYHNTYYRLSHTYIARSRSSFKYDYIILSHHGDLDIPIYMHVDG